MRFKKALEVMFAVPWFRPFVDIESGDTILTDKLVRYFYSLQRGESNNSKQLITCLMTIKRMKTIDPELLSLALEATENSLLQEFSNDDKRFLFFIEYVSIERIGQLIFSREDKEVCLGTAVSDKWGAAIKVC